MAFVVVNDSPDGLALAAVPGAQRSGSAPAPAPPRLSVSRSEMPIEGGGEGEGGREREREGARVVVAPCLPALLSPPRIAARLL